MLKFSSFFDVTASVSFHFCMALPQMLYELLNRFALSFAYFLLLFLPHRISNPNAHSLHGTFYLWIVRLTFMLELFRFAIIHFGNFSVGWWWCFRHYCLGSNIVVLFSQMEAEEKKKIDLRWIEGTREWGCISMKIMKNQYFDSHNELGRFGIQS